MRVFEDENEDENEEEALEALGVLRCLRWSIWR
jgi:hypothetical protein